VTKIDNIMDREELSRLVEGHYISRVFSPDACLVLYNYTAKATYDRVWTPETRACRGLIVDASTGDVVARPFEKFSNVDEAGFPESALGALLARPGPVEITDKLDGSMIAVWHYAGGWHCSTRGSFASTQAQAAQAWIVAHANLIYAHPGYTYISEWCAPDNRVVLKYDKPELRLIGVRMAPGYDAPYCEVAHWAHVLNLPVVPVLADCDLEALALRRAMTTGVEGWVARWPDGFRVKIKTEDYLRLHRLISGFSAARVREAMLSADTARYIGELPEEIRSEAERIAAVLDKRVQERVAILIASHARLSPLLSDSRKAFALAVQSEPQEDRSFLFSLADGRPIADKLLKDIDLVALFGEEASPVEEL